MRRPSAPRRGSSEFHPLHPIGFLLDRPNRPSFVRLRPSSISRARLVRRLWRLVRLVCPVFQLLRRSPSRTRDRHSIHRSASPSSWLIMTDWKRFGSAVERRRVRARRAKGSEPAHGTAPLSSPRLILARVSTCVNDERGRATQATLHRGTSHPLCIRIISVVKGNDRSLSGAFLRHARGKPCLEAVRWSTTAALDCLTSAGGRVHLERCGLGVI